MRRNNPFFKKKAETQRLLKVKPLSGIYYVFKYMVKFLNYSVSKLQISLSIVCWDWMWGRRCFWDPAQFVLMLLGVSSLLQWEYHSTLLEYFFFLLESYRWLVCHVLNVNRSHTGVCETEIWGKVTQAGSTLFPSCKINLEVSFLPLNLFPPKRMICHHNFKNNFLKMA